MKVVRCAVCGRLTSDGQYLKLLGARNDRHRNTPDAEDEQFAESFRIGDPESMICTGSGSVGKVEVVPEFNDGFNPWEEE